MHNAREKRAFIIILERLMILNILFALSTAWAAEVKTVSDFTGLKCQTEFKELLKSKSWDQEKFRQHVAGSHQETVYRNLSRNIGQWIDVKLNEKNPPEVYYLNQSTIARFSFDNSCNLSTTNESWPWHLEKMFSKRTNESWTNEDLMKLVSSGKRGMIYYWSPRFSNSVYDLPRMEKLALKFGYEFTAVVDPRASSEEVLGALEIMHNKTKQPDLIKRSLASKLYFNRNISTDLYMRNGFNHFPVTYVYNKQKMHPRWIVGIMTDLGVKKMADNFSLELEGN